jgi:hypothetical protein
MKTFPVDLYSYRRIGDEGCSITLHTTVEIDSDDIKFLDDHRGMQSFLTISDTAVGLEVPDLDIDKLKTTMVENQVYDKDISPSERQRRKIWVLCNKELGKEPSKEEFESFYMKEMDKIDSYLLEKIGRFED